MTPERWQRIELLYHSALEREAEERSAFLAEACLGDEELRREVDAVHRSHLRSSLQRVGPAIRSGTQTNGLTL